MDRLDLKFLMLGAAMLVAGVAMGIFMAVTHDHTLSPVHAHVNLIGWVSLSLFGIVYQLFPELQFRRLARVHFLLAAPAAIMFPPGVVLAVLFENPLMAIVGSIMWFVGAVLFLIQLVSLAFGPASVPAHLVPAE